MTNEELTPTEEFNATLIWIWGQLSILVVCILVVKSNPNK